MQIHTTRILTTICVTLTKTLPLWVAVLLLTAACTSRDKEQTSNALKLDYKVHSILPHDTGSFTEGLLVYNGNLYESTGEHGRSWFGRINIKTGKPEKKSALEKDYFGEGITILNNKVYQLTWKTKKGFVYGLDDFEKIAEFTYDSEGWGLTHDSTHLIMSNGSDQLYFLDTATFEVVKKLAVTFQDKPVNMLNELEYVDGAIYANVWQTNTILKIDPDTGKTLGYLDLSSLEQRARQKNPDIDLLNGIAWYAPTRSLLVTGKNWPEIYALKLED